MARDYYQTLGITRSASDKDIRRAYRRLARKYHPDVNPGDRAAGARFKEINAAHEVLSDPAKRRKYDRYGDKWQYSDQIEEAQRRSAGRGSFGPGGSFDFGDINVSGDLGDLFQSVFRGFGRRSGRQRPRHAQQPVEVTLEEAYQGTSRLIEIEQEERCATCGGRGQVASAICHVCRGTGATPKHRRLEVKIPPGVRDGSRVRVASESGPGPAGAGDLHLVVSVRPHERFERRGDDLHTEAEVPLTDALLGGEVQVTTLTSRVMLKVPPLTQNGRSFRLNGLGMPHLNGTAKGDLYVRVKVKLPDQLSDREKKLFEELRGLEKAGPKS